MVEMDSYTLQQICYFSTNIRENQLIFQICTVQSLECTYMKDEKIGIKKMKDQIHIYSICTLLSSFGQKTNGQKVPNI